MNSKFEINLLIVYFVYYYLGLIRGLGNKYRNNKVQKRKLENTNKLIVLLIYHRKLEEKKNILQSFFIHF